MELRHQPPAGGLQLVQSYGEGGFRISGRRHEGSVLIRPDVVDSWPVATMAELSIPTLSPILDVEAAIEILIIGCGSVFAPAPVTLREMLRAKGIGIETMDTGAACRTYNVLAGENRRVAAALMAL
ncbi:MAG: Mth938-like domain-containing protein [Geminicoccaceae bacterium]